jgi:hypothetical protein
VGKGRFSTSGVGGLTQQDGIHSGEDDRRGQAGGGTGDLEEPIKGVTLQAGLHDLPLRHCELAADDGDLRVGRRSERVGAKLRLEKMALKRPNPTPLGPADNGQKPNDHPRYAF